MRPSIDDRGQTDRVTMHATDCCTLLFANRSNPNPNLDLDLDFQSPASYGYETYDH